MGTTNPIQPQITHLGQNYVDKEVIINPKESEIPTILAEHVAKALNAPLPVAPKPVMVGYNRVHINWLKPDGNGGFVPKYPRKANK